MVAGKPRGTGAGRIGARAPLGALRGTFGHFHFGASLKPVRHSVSVIVSRAAHPTRKQRRAPRPRTPRPLHAELAPQTPAGACHPGDVVARRRAASMVQSVHSSRYPLAAHSRAPPAAAGRAPHSRRRASHTGAFLARSHVWLGIACVATAGRARPPPAHPGRRHLRRACPPAARRPSPLHPSLCAPPRSPLHHVRP